MLHNRIKNAREGNALPKGVSLSFLIPCGRDCVATMRFCAKKESTFSALLRGRSFVFNNAVLAGNISISLFLTLLMFD